MENPNVGEHHHEHHGRDLEVEVRVLDDGAGYDHHLRLEGHAPLLRVIQEGAQAAAVKLLPNPEAPLDELRNIHRDGALGPAIENLDETLADFLKKIDATREFGIRLVRAFRVNTRWAVAPEVEMTPRAILALPAINLNPKDYTLYKDYDPVPLPIDKPVKIERGEAFEAQRDGKYGGR